MPNRIAFCTIATPGFLPMAAVLIDSIKAHYGDACDIHLLTVSWEPMSFRYRGVDVVNVADLPNPYCWDMAMRYDVVERASAYKPFFMRHINAGRRYDIPIDRQHIIGHADVPDPSHPGELGGSDHHTDPGPYWKWGYYLRLVRRYARKIGLTRGFSAHSMRATFITRTLENGASLEEVQRAAGHADASTTKLYDRRGYNPEKSAAFFASY